MSFLIKLQKLQKIYQKYKILIKILIKSYKSEIILILFILNLNLILI